MRIDTEPEERIEVSMSPLIDCVFLLLIFFLVATMMKKVNKDIDIDLPISKSALEVPPDDSLVVVGIDAEGHVYYEGKLSSINQLHARLRELGQTRPNQRLRLDCDQSTPFERVVEVLDLCTFNGLRNVGVRTYDEHYNR